MGSLLNSAIDGDLWSEERQGPSWVPGPLNGAISSLSQRPVRDRSVVNLMNYFHFTGKRVLLHMSLGHEDLLFPAEPLPSDEMGLVLRPLGEMSFFGEGVPNILHVLIDEGKSVTIAPSEKVSLRGQELILGIDGKCYKILRRRYQRYACPGLSLELFTPDGRIRGRLSDFSSEALRIEDLTGDWSPKEGWGQGEILVRVYQGKDLCLEANCTLIRDWEAGKGRGVVLRPKKDPFLVFSRRAIRNPRATLNPAPKVEFLHPLLGREVQMEVEDMGTGGMCVVDHSGQSVLLPGLFLKDFKILLSGSQAIVCQARVVYEASRAEGMARRYGLAITDMGMRDYTRLARLILRAIDPNLCISENLDPDAVWRLFFGTGFIYPSKYQYVQANKKDFLKTYERVCKEDPDVVKCLTYKRGNTIYAHIGLVRAYERSWMIHHHAAQPLEDTSRLTGFLVLKGAMLFLNDIHRYPSTRVGHVICYYRPKNRFPSQVFGGFANHLKDPRRCSVHEFSYGQVMGQKRPYQGIELVPLTGMDKGAILEPFEAAGLSLLLSSLGFGEDESSYQDLLEAYRNSGIRRSIERYLLLYQGKEAGLVIINGADPGLNLSGLLSSIKLLLMPGQERDIPLEALQSLLEDIASRQGEAKVPVLCYPADAFPQEKSYILWCLDVNAGDHFMSYMRERFKL